jgi:hypothetical protein
MKLTTLEKKEEKKTRMQLIFDPLDLLEKGGTGATCVMIKRPTGTHDTDCGKVLRSRGARTVLD